jgi:tetratricopeptide (TPR) repeat protein
MLRRRQVQLTSSDGHDSDTTRSTAPRLVWLWVLVFATAFVLRAAYAYSMRESPLLTELRGDDVVFDDWAQHIARGEWLGREVFFQAPLYPYLLGALYYFFGHDLLVVRIFQALLGALGCVCVADATRRLLGRKAGIVAGLTLALFAPGIYYDSLFEKTALAQFELALLLNIYVRILQGPRLRPFAAAGVVLGAIALTRENAVILVLPILAWLWSPAGKSRAVARLSSTCILLGSCVLVLAPVAIRNSIVGGEWVLSTTNFGSNLYIGNHEGADGLYTPLRPASQNLRYENLDAIELAQAKSGQPMTSSQASDYWRDAAVAWMLAHPLDWLILTARKLAFLCSDREWMDAQSYVVVRQVSGLLSVLGTIFRWGTLFPLAALGLCVAWPDRRRLMLVYSCLVLLTMSIALFWIFGRFRMALVPFLVPFSSLAVCWLFERIRERSWGSLLRAAAPLASSAVLAFWPVAPDMEYPVADTYSNLGSALYRSGRLDEARQCFERARDDQPGDVIPYLGLGAVCAATDDVANAQHNFEMAAARNPDFVVDCHLAMAELHDRLGNLAQASVELERAIGAGPTRPEEFFRIGLMRRHLGDLIGAQACYERALAMRPDYPEAHNNLGYLLAHSGRESGAVEHYERAIALNPEYAQALVNLAWLYARPQDLSLRDLPKARSLATRAAQVSGPQAPGIAELFAAIDAESRPRQ